MEDKKIITLDLTGRKYLGKIHERIRVAFDFPEWYGANWDAFWDLLQSECDADEVVMRGVNTLPDEFGEDVKKIKKILTKKVQERENDSQLYDDINLFSFNVID